PQDGLLKQGAENYQLTWMDAKVDNWVVTPRRGKAVEINGLWYNALCLLADWLREEKREAEADTYARHAKRAKQSFNQRFWFAEGNYLYDVVDGETGTVWAWLIGPFIDAWLKVHPDDRAGARKFLDGFDAHLNEACVGSINEIFD